jgi:hypothetical protein
MERGKTAVQLGVSRMHVMMPLKPIEKDSFVNVVDVVILIFGTIGSRISLEKIN